MHTLKLKLKLKKYQYQYLNKVFFLAYRMYVRCVKYVQKQIRLLNRNKEYKTIKKYYGVYKKDIEKYENLLNKLDKDDKINKKIKSKFKNEYNNKIKHFEIQRISRFQSWEYVKFMKVLIL